MFEVTLMQKVKKIVVNATTAAEAVDQVMQEVKKDAKPFVPSSWTVKEKDGDE